MTQPDSSWSFSLSGMTGWTPRCSSLTAATTWLLSGGVIEAAGSELVEVVTVGQNLQSISSQAGQQLLNLLVTLHCLIGHLTTTQTTGECE